MKFKQTGPGKAGQRRPTTRMPHMPVEWMDPMSWRLPSGKALAEFALQAGFLAPVMLESSGWKRKPRVKGEAAPGIGKHSGEVPARPGSFRETGFRQTR